MLVAGNYQSGISVVDFSDRRTPGGDRLRRPQSKSRDPNPPLGIEGGGDWSTYWYDGYIYEGDMTRGLIVWKLKDRAVNGVDQAGSPQPADTGVLDPQPRTRR